MRRNPRHGVLSQVVSISLTDNSSHVYSLPGLHRNRLQFALVSVDDRTIGSGSHVDVFFLTYSPRVVPSSCQWCLSSLLLLNIIW